MSKDTAEFKRIVKAYYLNQFKMIVKIDKKYPNMNKNINKAKKTQVICNIHLKKLDEELTELLKLRYVEELGQDEISQKTGLSMSTIYRKTSSVTRLLKLDLILNKVM